MNPDDAQSCSVCMKKLDHPKLESGEVFKRKGEFYTSTQSIIPERKTILPVGAGAILVINAILAIGGLWITNLFVSEFLPEVSDSMAPVNLIFGGLAAFVLIGGILAMTRRMWGVCLVAAIASLPLSLMFGLFCGIVQVMLAVAALALIAQSRDEFRKTEAAA